MTLETEQRVRPLEDGRKIAGMAVAFHPEEKKALLDRVEKIADSAYFLWGDQQEELQKRFATLVERRHALVFSSVTTSWELLLRYLRDERGIDRVVFQGNAFPSMVFAARRVGVEVDWVDIELWSAGPSLEVAKRDALDRSTVLVLQHTGGVIMPDASQIRALCDQRGAFLLEDASQAVGSVSVDGEVAGGFGDVAVFSTSATKAFHTGQGGILVTDDDEIEEHLRFMRQYGRTEMFQAGEFVREGTNANQSEMNAAVGNVMLDTLQERIDYRRQILEAYQTRLTDGVQVDYVLAGKANLYKLPILPGAQYGWDREELKAAFKAAGIAMGSEVYNWVTPQLEVFGGAYDHVSLPNTEEWASTHICLPMHNVMTPADAIDVAERLVEWLDG